MHKIQPVAWSLHPFLEEGRFDVSLFFTFIYLFPFLTIKIVAVSIKEKVTRGISIQLKSYKQNNYKIISDLRIQRDKKNPYHPTDDQEISPRLWTFSYFFQAKLSTKKLYKC